MKTNPSIYKNSGTSPTLIIDEGVRPVILGGVVVNKEASTNHTPTPECPEARHSHEFAIDSQTR